MGSCAHRCLGRAKVSLGCFSFSAAVYLVLVLIFWDRFSHWTHQLGIVLSLPSQAWITIPVPWFWHGCWRINSGLHVWQLGLYRLSYSPNSTRVFLNFRSCCTVVFGNPFEPWAHLSRVKLGFWNKLQRPPLLPKPCVLLHLSLIVLKNKSLGMLSGT